MSSRCLPNMANFGPLTAKIGSIREFGVPQQISTGFTSCLRYCSDDAHPSPEANQALLKFAGVPQTNEKISAASGPKFTIL